MDPIAPAPTAASTGEPAAAASAEPDGRASAPSAEADSWAEVEARWEDRQVHLAHLARFPDLDGLTTAGRRYRAVLAQRPGDAMAIAMKAEILKRATVVGLASLPRSTPSPVAGGKWKRAALILLASWIGSALAYLLWTLLHR